MSGALVIDLCWIYHENRQKAQGLLPCGNRGGKCHMCPH